MARIEGRGIRKPNYELTHNVDGLMLRVDDELNDQLWFNVTITWEEIDQLIAGRMRAEGLAEMLFAVLPAVPPQAPDYIDLTAPPFVPEDRAPMVPGVNYLPEIPPPPGE